MEGKRKALIISISDYNDEKLENLEFCKNDGKTMYKTLTNIGYEIPKERNIVGKVGRKTMKTAIFNFFKGNHGNDTLLFYFSGHGVGDGFGGKFFANTDVDHEQPGIEGIPFEELNEQMERSYAKKIIAILDCCYSGDVGPTHKGKSPADAKKEIENQGSEGLHKVFEKSQGCCVLASSPADKKSYPLIDESESAFTHFIAKGLNGTKDSVDKNGFVTPESLSDYTFAELQKIPELKHQTPVKNISTSGKIILAEHLKFANSENVVIDKIPDEQKIDYVKSIKEKAILAKFMGFADIINPNPEDHFHRGTIIYLIKEGLVFVEFRTETDDMVEQLTKLDVDQELIEYCLSQESQQYYLVTLFFSLDFEKVIPLFEYKYIHKNKIKKITMFKKPPRFKKNKIKLYSEKYNLEILIRDRSPFSNIQLPSQVEITKALRQIVGNKLILE